MTEIIIGSALMSMLHALLPNHWLPIITIGYNQKWTLKETLVVTFIGALAHSLSTVAIGATVGLLGNTLSSSFSFFLDWVAPTILVLLGVFFIYQHHSHHHFHLSTERLSQYKSKWKFIGAIVIAMMFSPCLEISGFFLYAGAHDWYFVALISILYILCTVLGMLIWVWWLFPNMKKLDWHALEHKAGLIAGWILVVTGVLTYFIH